jgi:two-component system sensor histidine kinase BarA
MLNRIRRLNISLAAKCQLLFGSAVVLIISAALLVPWQRMEQLTEQLNETAGAAAAEAAVRQHVVTAGCYPTTGPVRPEPKSIRVNDHDAPPPRLVGIRPGINQQLTAWDKRVLDDVAKNPDKPVYSLEYKRRDGSRGFLYSQTLRVQRDCLACHGTPAEQAAFAIPRSTRPTTTFATTAAASTSNPVEPPPLIGIVTVDMPSQIRTSQVLLNRVFLLIAGLLAGTLAIVVFYLITTRLILEPVRVLQETAEKVSKGDLNIRSDINTGDEFQQLSETFNTMLFNLSKSADQLRSINKSLDVKVGQLAESNVALYESNRLKSEFLANVSHELRTPLNSILGFAELLKDLSGPDQKSTRYVQNILQSGRNLLELINDLLDLAKIEAGRMEVRSEPVSLNDLFEGLTNVLNSVTEPKSLTLESRVSADVPILETDPPKLQQVLYNFLSNAFKFSPPGSVVRMSAEPDADGTVRIEVSDQGPGIDPSQQSLIFEKFRQIDGSVTRQHSGTGLGLAISKELTSLLGGTIGVRSSPGEGATFWIRLPYQIKPSVQDVRRTVLSN